MIDEEWRYFAPGGGIFPGGPSTWFILDWDQRRIVAVTMDEEQDSEDTAVQHLKKHIDTLGSDVYGVHFSEDGELISVSTNSEDDEMTCVYYPPVETISLPDHVKTVLRSDLLELERLGPNVDLVSYVSGVNVQKDHKVVFKYYFLSQFIFKIWHEMNLWIRLPPHPNIVPLDRLVLDEIHGHVVGFTSHYIPGGTLSENQSRTFKLEWLRQLIGVIDDLNLKYGIVHQDVAARNLLVNPETDALMLFDFNYSGQIGGVGYGEDRHDVKGVVFTLYEIITRDMHFRDVPHDQQHPDDVLRLKEWKQHPDVQLDRPISEYRSVLESWVSKRRQGKQISVYTEAPDYLEWPDFPNPPPSELPWGEIAVVLEHMRRDEREKGNPILNWQRPAQVNLRQGDLVFADGRLKSSIEGVDSSRPNID